MIDDEEVGAGAGGFAFVRDPLGLVRRRWPFMLATLVLGIAASAAFVFTMQPRYRAEATLLVASQQIPEDFVRSTVPEDMLERVDSLVAQALTRDRIGELVGQYGLYPNLADSMSLAEIAVLVRGDVGVAVDTTLRAGRRQESALVFIVSFTAAQPLVAAQVANDIAGFIQAEAIRMRTQQAQLATGFLSRELEETERELREQERMITDFKRRYRGELPSEFDANLAKLERLQLQRQSLALQIAEAATRVTMLSATGGQPVTLEGQLQVREGELAALLTTATERHPDVVALRREIAALQARIAAAGDSGAQPPGLVASEQRTVRELQSQLAATEAEIASLDLRVARTPERQEELDALTQKATVLRDEYLEFLRKVQEAELAESLERAQQGERMSVLTWADPPTHPEQNRPAYLAAGIVASFGLALAAGVLLEMRDPVLIDTAQVEAATGFPVLGTLPHIS